MRAIILILFFPALVMARGLSEPGEAVNVFTKAIAAEDPISILDICSNGYIFSGGDNCTRDIRQFLRKKLVLKKAASQVREPRAIVRVEISLAQDKKGQADTITMLLVAEGKTWLLDGITKSEKLAGDYLAGTAAPREEDKNAASPDSMRAILALGSNFRSALAQKDNAGFVKLLSPEATGKVERFFHKLQEAGMQLRPEMQVRVSSGGDVASLRFVVFRGKDIITEGLFAKKHGAEWKIVKIGYDPEFGEAVLTGKINLDFDPQQLPGNAAIEKLFANLGDDMKKKKVDWSKYYVAEIYRRTAGLGPASSQDFLQQTMPGLKATSNLKVHYFAKNARAIAIWTVSYVTSDTKERFDQVCYFYIIKTPAGFRIVDHNYGENREWFWMALE